VKLVDALEILKRPQPNESSPFRVSLVCGFTPLHLQTFLAAELRQAIPTAPVELSIGQFDDLVGNIRRAREAPDDDVAVVVLEWADLDARLGLRRLGGWVLGEVPDIVETAERQAARLALELTETAKLRPVVCSLPTLPLPPLFLQSTYEAGAPELGLRAAIAALARDLAGSTGVRVLGAQRLDEVSPLSARHDPKSEISAGFPYTLGHASALAALLARLARSPMPKKGLITDLDDTLWGGVVGEDGPANVAWSEESGNHAHALYQQFLASLASAGVLIGAASKNEPSVVEEVFSRKDILLSKDAVFPFEVHWDSKSESVERILDVWNVAPDSVVFVDDSAMEIAQVQSVFPEIEGILFPGRDYPALLEFLARLRDIFGKHAATEEDTLRLGSIRSSVGFRNLAEGIPQSADDFLRDARGAIAFSCGHEHDARALELINKTNQFNLNGMRLGEAAFATALASPGAFLLSASYEDKFGSLGKIAAVLGRIEGRTVMVDCWVMSCRAFSRRIEHHCLSFLFEEFDASQIVVSFAPTERNRPLQEFLESILGADVQEGAITISRTDFAQRAPALVHQVTEVKRG
jgi:FkbH-like protein